MEVSASSGRILGGLLEARTGQRLSTGRYWRIEAALKGVMRLRHLPTLAHLVASLAAGRDQGLADDVVDALLNNETYFFRDRAPFELLINGALPRLQQARLSKRKLSLWCAGCATGQEAYSLAMAFAEDPVRWRGWTIDILATDVSASAIERAREGRYSQFEVQRGLPVVQMLRWFSEESNGHWQISPVLRRAIRFEVHDLRNPAPDPGCFDAILCRNTLLYFSQEMRRQTFTRLAEASAEDACLMLGAAETVIGHTNAFTPDPDCRGLYVRSTPKELGFSRSKVLGLG